MQLFHIIHLYKLCGNCFAPREAITPTEEKVILNEDMNEVMESINETEESTIMGFEETSIVETETKEEVSIL